MKKFLSLVLALVMTMSLVTISAGAKDFTDGSKINYKEAVDVISAVKVVDGYEDGSFNPQATLTRGAAAKIICNLILGPTTASALSADAAPFSDVPANSTFAGYIAYCSKAGIISGYADGTFKPGNTLTTYAYMKMLLGALGYDSDIEGYAGSNWSINVAKQALNIGLDKGLKDDLNGIKPVTREEACLFALNTLKADLVEYSDKGSTITINGVTITSGASKATPVTSTKDSKTIADETEGAPTLNKPDVVQFAEKYFPKLALEPASDAFMRPSNLWKLKGVKIGAYAKTPDLTYTKKTKSDTIYDDLGLSETIVATTYEDGAHEGTFTVKNGDTDTKIGKQGVLTEVFKTETANKVYLTITKINTYVGDVTAKVAATKTKDAYISIASRGDQGYKAGNFDTTEFALDDVVLYTYSEKQDNGADKGVQSVVAAETVKGELTSFTEDDSAVIGGTKYDYAEKIANAAKQADLKTEVTAVLDTYGNVIDIDGNKADNYAVILATSDASDIRTEAKLLFPDGTIKVVSTTDDYSSMNYGDIVTYVLKSGDSYKLTTKSSAKAVTSGKTGSIKNNTYTFDLDTNDAANNTANGKTIFLIKTIDANGDSMYKAYEGIKNVPDVNVPGLSTYNVFCKLAGNLANIVFVDATKTGATVLDPSSDVIFVKGTDDRSYTADVGTYYLYKDAIKNGEKVDDGIKATTHVADDTYGMFDGVYYNNGIVTMSITDNVIRGEGVYKQFNEVLGTYEVKQFANDTTTGHVSSTNGATVGAYAYYPVAKDLKVAFIDEDGDISTGYTINSVSKDSNDIIYFKLNASKEVTYAVILKMAGGTETVADEYTVTLTTPGAGYDYVVKKGGVAVTGKSGTTAGATTTIGLPKGTYTVTFSKAGYPTVDAALTVTEDGGAAAYGTLRTLTYAVPSANNTGAKIVVKKGTDVVFEKTNATTAGTLQLLEGTYTVEYTADIRETYTESVTVGATGATFTVPAYNAIDFTGLVGNNTITIKKGDDVVKTIEVTGATAKAMVLGDQGDYTYTVEGDEVMVNPTGNGASSVAIQTVSLKAPLTAVEDGKKLKITLAPETAGHVAISSLPSTWKVDIDVYEVVGIGGGASTEILAYSEECEQAASAFASGATTTQDVVSAAGTHYYNIVVTLYNADGVVVDSTYKTTARYTFS